MKRLLAVLLSICLLAMPAGGQAGPGLALSETRVSKALPLARPDWPRPDDPHMVFFLQRSMNRNTVVYAARYDAEGRLARRPVAAYWRRYEEQNQAKPLKLVERMFAYGVKTRAVNGGERWQVTFAPLSALTVEMRQTGPFQSALWARINNRDYKLIYGFLDLDGGGLVPRVVQLRLYTYDPVSENHVTHLISVSGGDIQE
ncbi:DUF4833 domain-containing protein [Shimia sp.]|uniref:DUF4833 domain-containing protein n=1 Tax=Shimia sp. TaxID=1954381 RepID=UPI0035626098